MTMHIGLVGGGNITETHARAARAIPGVAIAAIHGTNAEKVARLSRDFNAKPYQDFADLIATRNALIHYKVLDKITFAEDGSAFMAEPKILKRLESKGILSDIPAGLNVAWIERVGTPATARWACETAAAMVQSIIASLPEGLFKRVAEAGFGKSFQIP